MKLNMTLPELVQELENQKNHKADYVVPSSIVRMENGLIVFPNSNGGSYEPNEVMHQHLAEKLGIPANYYRRMQAEAPELLEKNINAWFEKSARDKQSLIRTFEFSDNRIARGMLSDRYGIIDNYDVLFAALSAITESGVKVDIRESNVTDKRLYINIVAPNIEVQSETALRGYLRDSAVGNGIITGLSITNSEVGFGSYEIRPRAFVKKCSNGLIIKDDSFRRVHLGGKMDQGQIKWSKDTQNKNLELIKSQTADAVKQFLSEDYLSGVVRKIEYAAGVRLDNPIDALQNAVKLVAKSVTLTEENKNNILNYFVQDGDVSGAGVMHAMTKEAQNLDADNRFEMETKAFEILPQIKSFDVPFVSGKN